MNAFTFPQCSVDSNLRRNLQVNTTAARAFSWTSATLMAVSPLLRRWTGFWGPGWPDGVAHMRYASIKRYALATGFGALISSASSAVVNSPAYADGPDTVPPGYSAAQFNAAQPPATKLKQRAAEAYYAWKTGRGSWAAFAA